MGIFNTPEDDDIGTVKCGDGRMLTPEPKCDHCGWPEAIHGGNHPGCPCRLCGKYGHRWVDCELARNGQS